MSHERASVVVLGSINVDSTSYVERFPQPGETVAGTAFRMALGGKGANQAVAARLADGEVEFVGRVGSDAAGDFALAELSRLGIATGSIRRADGAPTGVAQITVAADGENTVIVTAGANATVDAAAIRERTAAIARAAVAVVQGEVPVEAISELARRCDADGTRMLFNFAPPVPVDAHVLAVCDPLVVNQLEAIAAGIRPIASHGTDPDSEAWRSAAGAAVGSLCRSVVITLGSSGAVAADADGSWFTAAPRVTAVDTTGAGDCFVGTLAAALAAGSPLRVAVPLAVAAATLSVRARGTVDSYADAGAVMAFAEQEGLA